jgi:hypothetical protein
MATTDKHQDVERSLRSIDSALQGLQEIRDRLRRLETRTTKFMESQGFDTHVQRARWQGNGKIEVPAPSCSLKEVLDAVPEDWPGDIDVIYDGKKLCQLLAPYRE